MRSLSLGSSRRRRAGARQRDRRPALGDDRARARQARRRRHARQVRAGRCAPKRRSRSFACRRAAACAWASSSWSTYKDETVERRRSCARRRGAPRRSSTAWRPSSSRSSQAPPPPQNARRPHAAGSDDPLQGRGVRDALARAAARREREDQDGPHAPRSPSGRRPDFEDRIENGVAAVRPRADDALPRRADACRALPGAHQREHVAHRSHRGAHQRHRRRRRRS